MKTLGIAFIIFLLFPIIVRAIAVGIAPSIYRIEAEAGKAYKLEVIIDLRDSGTKVPINLRCSEIDLTTAREDVFAFNLSETSEQSTCAWVNFLEKKIVVEDTGGYVKLGGKLIPADKFTTAIIKVPENVEPGYHLGHIDLIPEIEAGGRGFGAQIITTASSTYVIKSAGEAVRSAQIVNFFAERVDENKIRIHTIVKNNGTVTIRAMVDELILTRNNKTINFPPAFGYIKPGETAHLLSTKTEPMENGDYEVKARVSWLTGSDYAEGKVRITPYVKIPVVRAVEVRYPKIPWYIWFVPVALVIIFVLLRRGRGKIRQVYSFRGYSF